MISISITPAAYDAIQNELLSRIAAEPKPGPDGLIRIWLDRKFVDPAQGDARAGRELFRCHLAIGGGVKEPRPALRKGRAGRDGTRSRRAETARARQPVNTPAPGIVVRGVASSSHLTGQNKQRTSSPMDDRDCLALYPFVVVRIACRVCSRRGAYRLARLAAKHGPETSLRDVLDRFSYDCLWRAEARSKRGKSACGV